MKKIVYGLIAVNVALLVWSLWNSADNRRKVDESTRNIVGPEIGNLSVRSSSNSKAEGSSREQCFFVGPFEQRDLPEPLQSLRASDESDSWAETSREEAPLWWVFLPPATTREAAEQQLSALQERGIDSFRIDGGDYRNAISLGYFRSRENAGRLTDEYTQRDIEARLLEIPQRRALYWYRASKSVKAGEIRKGAESADATVENRACDWVGEPGR